MLGVRRLAFPQYIVIIALPHDAQKEKPAEAGLKFQAVGP